MSGFTASVLRTDRQESFRTCAEAFLPRCTPPLSTIADYFSGVRGKRVAAQEILCHGQANTVQTVIFSRGEFLECSEAPSRRQEERKSFPDAFSPTLFWLSWRSVRRAWTYPDVPHLRNDKSGSQAALDRLPAGTAVIPFASAHGAPCPWHMT